MLHDQQLQASLKKVGDVKAALDEHAIVAITDPRGKITFIGHAVQRRGLTRQLLLFSRKEVLRAQDLDLNESIESMLKMLRRTIGEDVQIQLNLARQPMWLHADPGMLDQVLLNLSVNARDAMPQDGAIGRRDLRCGVRTGRFAICQYPPRLIRLLERERQRLRYPAGNPVEDI